MDVLSANRKSGITKDFCTDGLTEFTRVYLADPPSAQMAISCLLCRNTWFCPLRYGFAHKSQIYLEDPE